MTAPTNAPRKKARDRTAADRIPGKAHGALIDLLGILEEELRTAKPLPDLPPLATSADLRDPTLVRLSRPRGNLEMARTILLAQDPAFSVGEELPCEVRRPTSQWRHLRRRARLRKRGPRALNLAPIFRVGIEARPVPELRLELAYVREFWSVHDSIDLTPEGVAIEGIAGLPRRVPIPSIKFPRNFQDSNSYRLGAEYTFKLWVYAMDLRSGMSFETTAIPRPYLSLLTIDMDKITLAVGGGLHIGDHWRFDMTYAHLFASSVNVPASAAKIPRVNPIAGNAPFEAVNGGRYAAAADLIGVGLQYTF